MLSSNIKLGVIGCGKMAGAILTGVFKSSLIKPENIYVYDINPDFSKKLSGEFGFNQVNSIEELMNSSDTLFLAVKPFVFDEVIQEIKKYYNNQLVLSIIAGVKIKKYLNSIENIKIIRIMPNTPALVNEGMSAICADKIIKDDDINIAYQIMHSCGEVIITTEDKIDIITALSGSGPAFYFKIIELMAKSAQKLGLSYDDAILLSAKTALGSAKMVLENNFDINQLIKNVTTPGGCTAVGNDVLLKSDIDKIFDKTIKDTMQKAVELG